MAYYEQDEIEVIKFLLFQNRAMEGRGIVHFSEDELAEVCPLARADKILSILENEGLIDTAVFYPPGAKKKGDSIYGFELNDLRARLESLEGNQPKEKAQSSPFAALFESWELVVDQANNRATLRENGVLRYEFDDTSTNKYRYFDCIWKAKGNHVPYKAAYEHLTKEKYPEAGRRSEENKKMASTIKNLRSEKNFFTLPFTIQTKRGFRLVMK